MPMFTTQEPTHCPKCQSKTCEDYRTGGKNHLSFAVIGLLFVIELSTTK